MLDLSLPPRPLEGVLAFPDHAAAGKWWVTGQRVRPARPDGVRLDLYRGGASGGFLQLELTADPEPTALEAARLALGEGATLAPVDWVRGEVWLAGRLGEADVASVVGQPGTSGSTATIVAVRVGEDLARVLAAALRGNATPAVVGIHLEGVGLAGPLAADIEADMGAVYDAFAAQGALITPVGRARVALLLEELEKAGAIRVHLSDEAGDETRSAALVRFGEDLVRSAFTPVAMAALAPTLDPAFAKIELQFKLSFRNESFRQHLRWSYRERATRRFSHFVSASILGWAADPSRAVREHTLEPDAGPLEILAVGDFAEVTVELAAPVATSRTLAPPEPRAEVLLAPSSRATLRYRVTTRLSPGRLLVDQPLVSDWTDAPGALALLIDPAVAHHLRPVSLELLAADTGCLGVDLRMVGPDGTPARTVTLDPSHPRTRFDTTGLEGWRMVRRWRYAVGEVEDEASLDADLDVLLPPTRVVGLRVVVVAEEGLEAVDLTVVGGGPPAFREELTLVPGDPSRALDLVVPRGGPEGWTWTATLVYSDGRTRVETGGPARVLVLGPPEGVRRIAVVLPVPPADQGFAAITLTLRAGDASAFTWVDATATDAVLTLPGDAPKAWTVEAEGLRLDGGRVRTSRTGDSDLLVLPPLSPDP